MTDPFASVDLFGDLVRPTAEAVLKKRFLFPPFTVLSARDGDWQERKRAWLLIGIRSELGRTDKRLGVPGGSALPAPGKYDNDRRGLLHGMNRSLDGRESIIYAPPKDAAYRSDTPLPEEPGAAYAGTSVFDPVLCELLYRWFCPPGGAILDPFAGGSVRGVVASALGRRYTGIDLRAEQIEANRAQLDICDGPPPTWICGDSREAEEHCRGYKFDFLFSCPPYADLERYSDDPADLSTLAYADFKSAYSEIIAGCAAMLHDNSFACFVVGDVRGKDGNYYGFPGDTIAAFKAAGLTLYNEAILVISVGSLPVRINAMFTGSRKLGKTHQNILVFLKGDAKKAAAKCEKLGQESTGTAA